MILTIRTDKPEAEIGLFDADGVELSYERWHAHRELEATILQKIDDLLQECKQRDEEYELQGIVTYAGPGSFTGLRIGFAVTNALAWARQIPNAKATGDNWIADGIAALESVEMPQTLSPDYGSQPHITTPRK